MTTQNILWRVGLLKREANMIIFYEFTRSSTEVMEILIIWKEHVYIHKDIVSTHKVSTKSNEIT